MKITSLIGSWNLSSFKCYLSNNLVSEFNIFSTSVGVNVLQSFHYLQDIFSSLVSLWLINTLVARFFHRQRLINKGLSCLLISMFGSSSLKIPLNFFLLPPFSTTLLFMVQIIAPKQPQHPLILVLLLVGEISPISS